MRYVGALVLIEDRVGSDRERARPRALGVDGATSRAGDRTSGGVVSDAGLVSGKLALELANQGLKLGDAANESVAVPTLGGQGGDSLRRLVVEATGEGLKDGEMRAVSRRRPRALPLGRPGSGT
jgi:hypothetical protein